jgi:hypothetical protein
MPAAEAEAAERASTLHVLPATPNCKDACTETKTFKNAVVWVGHLQRSVIIHLDAISRTARWQRLHQIAQKAADHFVYYAVWPSQTNRTAATLRCINSPLQLPVFSQCIARPRLHARFNT